MHHPIIAIIGAGNMGSSLISGLIRNGHPSSQLFATDPRAEKQEELIKTFAIHATADNVEAASAADIVVFAVKPQIFSSVAVSLRETIQKQNPLVISVAAGITLSSIQRWLGGGIAIVRAMPNTPALISCGAAALYANELTTPEQRSLAESILRSVGVATWLDDEKQMDTVTALSGSGPAYFFLMMEALQQAAEQCGLPEETARLLTLQTSLGAARMAIESGTPLSELRHNVTSPGGTTERAIAVLEDNRLRDIFLKAVQAAKQRSEELASMMDENEK